MIWLIRFFFSGNTSIIFYIPYFSYPDFCRLWSQVLWFNPLVKHISHMVKRPVPGPTMHRNLSSGPRPEMDGTGDSIWKTHGFKLKQTPDFALGRSQAQKTTSPRIRCHQEFPSFDPSLRGKGPKICFSKRIYPWPMVAPGLSDVPVWLPVTNDGSRFVSLISIGMM